MSLQIETSPGSDSYFTDILLIEDEPAHARLLSRSLGRFANNILHAASGKEALEVLQSQFVDIVLCDLHLPDITGIELLPTIYELRSNLPVIVMTSSNSIEDAVAAMREGAWDYMVKSFSADLDDRLTLVLNRAMERHEHERRQLELTIERNAFWEAARTAQDGLAVLGLDGTVVYFNQAFSDFASEVDSSHQPGERTNIVDLTSKGDEAVASALRAQLQKRSKESLWSSELRVEVAGAAGDKNEDNLHEKFYELTLTSVAASGAESSELLSGSLANLGKHVVWVRDISQRKEQERFQRDLLSTTTHDLKGPLGAILTSAELLSESESFEHEKVAELATRVGSCARNAVSLIDELLSARRIQDGVLVVRPRWYVVDEILEDIHLDYLPTAKAKNITFTFQNSGADLKIYADRLGLSRVLGNMISNAIKFTPKDGAVTLSAEHVGGEVRISVADNGPGIESEARRLLFRRYARLEKHRETEGTGLGLFVAKNIMEAHGGHIDVESEVGEGTTFVLCFPDGPVEPD